MSETLSNSMKLLEEINQHMAVVSQKRRPFPSGSSQSYFPQAKPNAPRDSSNSAQAASGLFQDLPNPIFSSSNGPFSPGDPAIYDSGLSRSRAPNKPLAYQGSSQVVPSNSESPLKFTMEPQADLKQDERILKFKMEFGKKLDQMSARISEEMQSIDSVCEEYSSKLRKTAESLKEVRQSCETEIEKALSELEANHVEMDKVLNEDFEV